MKSGSYWKLRFKELVAFQRAHGHCRVPTQWPQNRRLARWVSGQRVRAGKHQLAAERRRRLEAIGFTWSVQDLQWEKMFEQMAAFARERGHCIVPHRQERWRVLKIWGWQQRMRLRRGLLKAERRRRLEAIGFVWNRRQWGRECRRRHWEKKIQALESFHRQHGRCPATGREQAACGLKDWMRKQRRSHREGRLPAEKKRRLEALGFDWRSSAARREHWRWAWWYERLKAFRERFGHCRAARGPAPDDGLAGWIRQMRVARVRGRLSAERIARLEALGFEWIAPGWRAVDREQNWLKSYAELKKFKARHGHCVALQRLGAPKRLADWLRANQMIWRAGRLGPHRVRLLRQLGVTPQHQSYLDWRLAQLQGFYQTHGHWRVPLDSPDHVRLARWLEKQRHLKRRGRLSAERLARLDDIGFE
jgi:hypothetical protein